MATLSLSSLVVLVFVTASYLLLMVNCISLPSSVKTFGELDADQRPSQIDIEKAIAEALAYRNLVNYIRPNSLGDSFASNIRTNDKRSAMGIDLPDFLLNYNGKVPVTSSYREKMERNGR